MFELADRLVGIYKTYDTTKSVTINPKVVSAAAMSRSENRTQSFDVACSSEERPHDSSLEVSKCDKTEIERDDRADKKIRKALKDTTNTI